MNKIEIQNEIKRLGPWYHNIELGGVFTISPNGFPARGSNHKKIIGSIPENLFGKTVLDLGCNAGYFSMVCKERGSKYVCGIDYNPTYIAQAKFCSKIKNMDIDYRQMSILDIKDLNKKFDLVLCIGLLYHVPNIHDAIKSICLVANKTILVETATSACTKQLLDSPIPLAVIADNNKEPGHWHVNIACLNVLFKKYGNFENKEIVFKGGRTCILFEK